MRTKLSVSRPASGEDSSTSAQPAAKRSSARAPVRAASPLARRVKPVRDDSTGDKRKAPPGRGTTDRKSVDGGTRGSGPRTAPRPAGPRAAAGTSKNGRFRTGAATGPRGDATAAPRSPRTPRSDSDGTGLRNERVAGAQRGQRSAAAPHARQGDGKYSAARPAGASGGRPGTPGGPRSGSGIAGRGEGQGQRGGRSEGSRSSPDRQESQDHPRGQGRREDRGTAGDRRPVGTGRTDARPAGFAQGRGGDRRGSPAGAREEARPDQRNAPRGEPRVDSRGAPRGDTRDNARKDSRGTATGRPGGRPGNHAAAEGRAGDARNRTDSRYTGPARTSEPNRHGRAPLPPAVPTRARPSRTDRRDDGALPRANAARSSSGDIGAPRTKSVREYLDEAAATDEGVRLSKRMSELGMCSRREADEWIEKGWVKVDGQVADTLGVRVKPDQKIDIAPQAMAAQQKLVTILLHKPVGHVSGQPEDGHPPAVALVTPSNHWDMDGTMLRFTALHLRALAPAGRLDIDSTGLLVFTQDGRVAKQLIGEQSEVDKEYLVRVRYGRHTENLASYFPEDQLALLRHGLSLDDVELQPAQVDWQNGEQLRFVLREGRKRQIRRMCEAVGLEVLGLKRVRIGGVMLGALPPGQWRYLAEGETF
ncbi:pseudouridine synthase [Robbsia andropogonis]|uniref:pseudouridine synthase n=1 Tax=Robbsia andropogonis TaxID=28092 RepID=UPI0009E42E74|nr:pseudouridine synthase [Robbsia andropogonis]